MGLSYTQYLELNKILTAQNPLTPNEHDEHLFITIHQSYELWFKQILHEGSLLSKSLEDHNFCVSLNTLQRILKILKTLVQQVDILETLSPLSFLAFRDRLGQASGFQSVQFRMLEFTIGYKNQQVLSKLDNKDKNYHKLIDLIQQPTLYDYLMKYLNGIDELDIPNDILHRDYSIRHQHHKKLEEIMYYVYKNHPTQHIILEHFIDLDEGFQEWRYRHLKMVERTIGGKIGTGGSAGISYLMKYLFDPAFPELWSVRNKF